MPVLHKLYSHAVFQRPSPLTTRAEIVSWWERRRLFFNLVVGATGIFTCLLMLTCAFISEPIVGDAIELPDGPILAIPAIFIYGVAANCCYTLGWIVESGLQLGSSEKHNALGLKLFQVGVSFSILLTLCPAVLCWSVFTYMWVTGQHVAPH